MSETKSQITLIMAVEKPQQKTFTKDAKGEITSIQIRPNHYWSGKTDEVNSLQELHDWFLKMLKRPNAAHYAVMRGEWLPDDVLQEMEEKRLVELKAHASDPPHHLADPIIYKEKNNPSSRKLRRLPLLTEKPLHWVCFDFDGVEVDGVEFTIENPWPAVNTAIKSELGDEFVGCDYILQLSSSAGIKPGIRAHVWFWMEKPFLGAHWRAWYKKRKEVLKLDCEARGIEFDPKRPYIDKAMFGVERIHLIAPPKFKPEDANPFKNDADRWLLFDMFGQNSVRLDLPEIEEQEKTDYFDAAAADLEEAQDAWTRPGIVGIYNRCYSMSETIQTFLDHTFRIDSADGRVTWLEKADKPGGLKIVAGNTKMFSTHNSDPREGKVGNAFDYIQDYLFDGDFQAAAAWAESLERCQEEKARMAGLEFDEIEQPAESFSPTIDLTVKSDQKIQVLTPERLMELYPMPKKWRKQDALYKLTASGWRYGYIQTDEDKKFFVELWSPITVWNRDISIQNGATSLHLKLMGHNGQPFDLVVNRGETVSKNILGLLWGAGWNASNKTGEYFVDFLRENGDVVKNTRLVSSHRGWFSFQNKEGLMTRAFAAPSGVVYGGENLAVDNIALRSDWILSHPKKGSIEGWKNAVDELCKVDNVPHWILGVAAGLVGPLMELFEGNTSGIVFGGDTSRGKTTALGWAASAWSSPDERRGGLMKSLRTTANAVESLAVGANGTALLLDETNLIDGKLLEGVVYTVASGNGKQRLKVDGTARDTSSWSTFVLMSGEAGLAQRFESASGKKMGKGAAVRLLDFDVSNVNGGVPIATIRSLRDQVFANHGWAGELFVDYLIKNGFSEDTRELWSKRKQFMEALAGKNAVGVIARAAEMLATICVAVDLSLNWGILPLSYREKFDEALAEIWRQVVGGAVFNSHNEILNQVRTWIHAKWDRSIVEVGSDKGVRDVDAWYTDEFIFVPTEKLIEATNGVVREAEIRKALLDQNCIESFSNGDRARFTFHHIPSIGRVSHYRLVRKMFRDLRVSSGEDLKAEDIF